MKLFLVSFIVTLFFVPVIYAYDGKPHGSEASESSPSATPVFNSFELFWPLSAGKTRADSMYIIKMWKENVRGWLIFGAPQKVEYRVLRATKRMLEVEKLMTESKNDLAIQTVESSNQLLKLAYDQLVSLNDVPDDVKSNVKNRLDNLIKLNDTLRTQSDGQLDERIDMNHVLIVDILKKVTS